MVRDEYLVYSVVDMAYARNWSVVTLYSYALYLVYAVAFVAPLRVAYGGVEAHAYSTLLVFAIHGCICLSPR